MSKKEEILKKGAKIIHLKGYHNTGINEILKSSGVPKGSFYFYFKNKEDFGLQLIDYLSTHFTSQANKHFLNSDKMYLGRLSDFFDEFQRYFNAQICTLGCPIGNLSLEMSDLSETFRKKLAIVMESMKQSILKFLTAAQDNREISSTFDINEISDFIINSWEGAVLRMKVNRDISPMNVFKKTIFESILSNELEQKNTIQGE